jgi:vanillate O-demethylase monooxygenase subunit
VHRSSFGNADSEDTPVQTITGDAGVTAARWMLDVEVAPFYRPMVRFQGRCDRLQHYEVRFPSHAIIKAVFTPAGSGGGGKPISPDAMLMDSYNFMTPVDEDHTRYFWFQACSGAQLDQNQSELMEQSVTAAFHEDRVILEAVHRGLKHQVSPHINLTIDRASVMFRQRLRQLIAGEQPTPAQGRGSATGRVSQTEVDRDARPGDDCTTIL